MFSRQSEAGQKIRIHSICCCQKTFKGYGANLKQAGNFQSGHSRNSAGQTLHLVGELFIHAAAGFVHGRANQVLQQFLIFSGKHFGIDAQLR